MHPPNFELTHFTSDQDLAETAAQQWLDELPRSAFPSPLYVALSGGRITKKFFAAVVEGVQAGIGSFAATHFFWADERCVPPTDPESNFAMAQSLLFDPLKIPDAQIHRIQGENPPDAAAREIAADMRKWVPLNEDQMPVLDWVFLGMGEDGHVASLFPDAPKEIVASRQIYQHVVAAKPPSNRITLDYNTIAAARRVWVLASGSDKETALKESLSESGLTPLARVLQQRDFTRIFTDIKL